MSFYLNIIQSWLPYLSVILILINVIIYYFGKLISSVRPQRESRIIIYLNGLLFSAIIIGVPLIIIMSFSEILINASFWIYLTITLIVAILLSKRLTSQHLDYNSVKEFADFKVQNTLKPIMSFFNFNYKKFKIIHDYIHKSKIGNFEGIFVSFVSLSFFYKSLFLENMPMTFISGLFLFFILSSVATLYSWRSVKRTNITIILKDKTKIKGIFKKFQEDYLEIITKEKNIIIPLNSINYFETNIFNKNNMIYKEFLEYQKNKKN
jgi:hypothetical protein